MTTSNCEWEFRTSSFSGGNGCVEVAPLPDGNVAVRDSKDRSKPAHIYTAAEWRAFISGVQAGEFNFS